MWPRTTIATAAVEVFFPESIQASRKPAIMADAVCHSYQRALSTTGNFFIDEEVVPAARRLDNSGDARRRCQDIFLCRIFHEDAEFDNALPASKA